MFQLRKIGTQGEGMLLEGLGKNSRRNPCCRCGEFGHTFMQCERRNRLAHGGASAREKAYKVACAVPIRKFGATENEKLRGENCRGTSEEKKDVNQKLQEYLELKDGRKIGILNGACLEESLNNETLTTNRLIGNKSVTVLRDTGCFGGIVKRELVAEGQLTSNIEYVMTVARTLLKAPFANVKVSTLDYSGIGGSVMFKGPTV